MLRSLFLTLAFASLASAHICMWSPLQRGAIVLDSPGDPSCSHKGPSPCGGVASSGPPTKYTAGQAVTVEFQQSLNHFYGPNPGYLTVQIAKGSDPLEPDFSYQFGSVVPDWNAMDEVAFANITVAGSMPPFECDACVLRLTYQSRNPGENDTSTAFYQCADIVIGAAAEESTKLFPEIPAAVTAPSAPRRAADDSGCCTVPQWESLYYTAGGVPFAGAGNIHYDATNQLMMSATQIGTGSSNDWEGHFSNFSSGIEWRYRSVGGVESCSAYGVDEWNNWCYGSGQNEAYSDSISIGGESVAVYANLINDWSWGVAGQEANQCVPVFRQHGSSAILQEYFNVTSGIADASVFRAPAACHTHHRLERLWDGHHKAEAKQRIQAWELQQGSDIEATRAFAKALPRAPAAEPKTHLIPAQAAAVARRKQSLKHHAATHKKHGGNGAQHKQRGGK